MTEVGIIRCGTSVIPYVVVRSARRRKTYELSVSVTDGVTVAAPLEAPLSEIERLIERRASWVLKQANGALSTSSHNAFVSGETVPYRGREVVLDIRIEDVKAVHVRFVSSRLQVSVPEGLPGQERTEPIRKAVIRWYRRRARELATAAVERWATALGARPTRVKIRDQRKRWGSCGSDGTLRFNWRIAMLEPALIDYVVVHELVHLRHRNHSAEYWVLLNNVLPGAIGLRGRLKEIGMRLPL